MTATLAGMSVHVEFDLDDDTAAVLQRDARERGVDLRQAVADAASATARRLEGEAVERLVTEAEQERDAAGVYASFGIA